MVGGVQRVRERTVQTNYESTLPLGAKAGQATRGYSSIWEMAHQLMRPQVESYLSLNRSGPEVRQVLACIYMQLSKPSSSNSIANEIINKYEYVCYNLYVDAFNRSAIIT